MTDAHGTVTSVQANSVGNFYFEADTLASPFTARIVFQGRERRMLEAQPTADCNGCHTSEGTMLAPGRIQLP